MDDRARSEDRVLVVDDDRDMCDVVRAWLDELGYTATGTTSPQRALEQARGGQVDVLLADIRMEGLDGLELCRKVAELDPHLPVIVVTGHTSLDHAVGAIRAGAYDFLTKPLHKSLVGAAVERAVTHRRLEGEVRRLREAGGDSGRSDLGILGASRAMRDVLSMIERIATTDASVLVTGETGTGKELVAKAIHRRSARAAGPFVAINCAAVPASLIESELFGHAKGAFTDARGTRPGLFVSADGGTLFLDEVGELPLEIQPKLLRALQERRVRPVGGDQETPFDARVIAATNRDLEAEVEAGRFRPDLFYRIHVVRIEMPPLRARGTDVLALAQHFIARSATAHHKAVTGISPATAEKLLAYDWPGNVRELENAVDRAVALTRFEQLVPEDLPARVLDHQPSRFTIHADDAAELLTMNEIERRYIRRVLEVVKWNKSRAARVLGFDRRTLYRKLDRFGIDDRGRRGSSLGDEATQ